MDELKFTLKVLLFSVLILFVSQFEIQNETLESKASYALVESSTAHTLRETARGGALFIKNKTQDLMHYVQSKMARNDGGIHREPSQNN